MADGLSLRHRLWRRLPAGARRKVLGAAAGFLAPRASARAPSMSAGMVVGGEFSAATGMGEAARLYQAGCAAFGVLRGGLALGIGGTVEAGAVPPAAALLLAVNAPSLPLMLARAPRGFLRGRFVAGGWAWELPVAPESWRVGARYVNEVWACSEFTAAALEPLLPGRVRVVPYPLGLLAQPAPGLSRADFGLPAAAVVTTLMFGLGSSFARKNPLAAVAAFRAAFGARDDQALAIKMSGVAAFPKEAALVRAAVAGQANMVLFEGDWPAERVAGLLGVTDIVLSLHRSEGFGLVPAQAMLRGIPVVATGWSGNMQYMDADSAALVRYRLVKVKDPAGIYDDLPGAAWAAPDVDHAAMLLRELGDDAALRADLGARGRAKAAAELDGAALSKALAANGITG